MGMTKKLIVVVLLLVILLANVQQICFADYDNVFYPYNSSNASITSVEFNQPLNNVITNLRDNNYSSIISRYSSPDYIIKFDNIFIEFEVVYYSVSSLNSNTDSAFVNYINNYSSNLIISSDNIISNNLSISYRPVGYSSHYAVIIYISGSLEYKTSLQNMLLFNNVGLNENAFHSSGFTLNLFDSRFINNGYEFYSGEVYDYGVGSFNYVITSSFDRVYNNINGMLFYHYSNIFVDNGSTLVNTNFNDDTILYTFNNVDFTTTANWTCFVKANMIDNSSIKQFSLRSYKTSDRKRFNSSSSTNYVYKLGFYVMPPLMYNKIEDFIPSSTNDGTNTQLHLEYYECEWYELHYQLANAFIFMITEFPLLSDITNVIYSLFVMIKNSFNVLLQFNGFGVIFGVAMFAIVFGFILRLIIGD